MNRLMSSGARRGEKGSALIAILIAALIVAILWVARFRKQQAEEAARGVPDVRSIEGMQTAVDRTREVQELQKKQVEEMNRKMVDIDR